MRVGGQHHVLAALPLGKRPGTHCMSLGGQVCTGAENLARTGIWSPDYPVRSELLHRQICSKKHNPDV